MEAVARPVRSNQMSTRTDAFRAFARRGSPQVLALATALLLAARGLVGGVGRGDLLVAIVTVAIAGPVEWSIHRGLLHTPPDGWPSRVLGTGSGHREHHLDPPALDWLLLRPIDALAAVVGFGVVTAGWTIPLLLLTGDALAGPFLTGWMLAAVGLLHYEWVHLLVHTRYRCRSRYYARLARNHRLHHYRNERYWLGVTTNSGDRLLGTYPRDREAVPLSETARTLG